MIKLHADATIDIDKDRRIWIEASAECDPSEVNLDAICASLTEAVTTQALAAHDAVLPKFATPKPVGDETAKLRGEGKETDPLGTFGDD